MKRSLLISLVFLSAMTLAAPLSLAQKPDKPSPAERPVKPFRPALPKAAPVVYEKRPPNILELTSAEMYRYGREMYLRGNYNEAAKVFLQMLKINCSNKVAQYHLRKIAQEVPSLAFLNGKLDRLPCQSYDFTKEDFLPASVYYEKDPVLMLEQLISYKQRHQLSKKEMFEKISRYMTMVRELEATVAIFKNGASPADIERGKASVRKIENEINLFKNQLASERLEEQKKVQDIRTRLAAAEVGTIAPENAAALRNAVTQARIQLKSKEQSLAEKDQVIMTLQARFDDIQRRLTVIQDDLVRKNAQIEAIQINLKDSQNP